MGKNEWRNEAAWPLERAKPTRYLLHSSGNANTASGDGGLSTTASHSEAADTYVYDPPIRPHRGRSFMLRRRSPCPGPRDQRQVEARPDVLVYSTRPSKKTSKLPAP